MRTTLATTLLFVLHTASALAAGSLDHLDRSFGVLGAQPAATGTALLLLPDQRIIVGGSHTRDFHFHRLLPDGSLDASFGANGTVQIDIGSDDDVLWKMAVTPDGRIVGVGHSEIAGWPSLAAVRLLSDGTADPTFGVNGIVTAIQMKPYDVLLEDDGGMLVVGYSEVVPGDRNHTSVAVARLLSDGSLDSSWANDGVASFRFTGERRNEAWGAGRQSTGKIVIGGVTGHDIGSDDFLLLRIHPDGTLDSTFGAGGFVRTQISPDQDTIYAIQILPDDRILAVGQTYPQSNANGFGIARYLADGGLDPTFAGGGHHIVSFSRASRKGGVAHDYARAVAMGPEGSFYVAGGPTVARFRSDGSFDREFAGGAVSPIASEGAELFKAVAVQQDGKVLVSPPVLRILPCTCGPCEACSEGTCVSTPRTDCHRARLSSIKIVDSRTGRRALQWKWAFADDFPSSSLGYPHFSTDYALCAFETSAEPAAIAARAFFPAGNRCGGKDCWKASSDHGSIRYRNTTALDFAVGSASVESGVYPKTSATVKVIDADVDLEVLGNQLDLLVQLQNESGECWEMDYGEDDVRKRTPELLQAGTDYRDY